MRAPLDPLLGYGVRGHLSGGQPCHAGKTAISVSGDGTVRRCHFIPTPIDNLYNGTWRAALRPRKCVKALNEGRIGTSASSRSD
jgi:MoaA/NifB/PqqE/SkfB family radical SAM enzyme